MIAGSVRRAATSGRIRTEPMIMHRGCGAGWAGAAGSGWAARAAGL